jgi:hypothetical protein
LPAPGGPNKINLIGNDPLLFHGHFGARNCVNDKLARFSTDFSVLKPKSRRRPVSQPSLNE